jgi:hypothetical protein
MAGCITLNCVVHAAWLLVAAPGLGCTFSWAPAVTCGHSCRFTGACLVKPCVMPAILLFVLLLLLQVPAVYAYALLVGSAAHCCCCCCCCAGACIIVCGGLPLGTSLLGVHTAQPSADAGAAPGSLPGAGLAYLRRRSCRRARLAAQPVVPACLCSVARLSARLATHVVWLNQWMCASTVLLFMHGACGVLQWATAAPVCKALLTYTARSASVLQSLCLSSPLQSCRGVTVEQAVYDCTSRKLTSCTCRLLSA